MADTEATIAHDGSIPGFLCACADVLNAHEPVPRVVRADEPESLFEARCVVSRDDDRAMRLWKRLSRRLGPAAMRLLLEAFMSDVPGADSAVARMMRRLWVEGPSVLHDLSAASVLTVEKAALRAREEGHRMCGLVRFSELTDGSWYAAIAPACDVLVLIGDHFATRFAAMRFAIHDRVRGSAIMHEPGQPWGIVGDFRLDHGSGAEVVPLSDTEYQVRELWRAYHRSIAIAERTNPRLQSSHMPRHYWNELVEMAGLSAGSEAG